MKLISLRHPPKVRSVWRAVLAGVVAQPLVVLLLTVAYWALRPFVWAAVYSEPYRSPPWSVSAGQWRVAVRAGHWLLCLFGRRRRRCTLVTARTEVAGRYPGRFQLHWFAVHSVPVGNIGYPERNLCRRRAPWHRSWSRNSLAPRG